LPAGIVSGLRGGLGDDLVAVVLFGSRARGEGHEGSDWDFLVIARDLPERTLERAFLLKRMLPAKHREREGRDLIWHWEQPPGPDWSLEWEEGS
jgi:predicted nucleotidyltransferase